VSNLRILLLGRQDEVIEEEIQSALPKTLTVDIAEHNTKDIIDFIVDKVADLGGRSLFIAEEAEVISARVAEKAQGMFQWVNLVLDALKTAKSKRDILKTLEEFPPQLDEAYTITFRRLSQRLDFKKDTAVLALKLLSAAYRSLQWDDLAVAVELQRELDEHHHLPIDTVVKCVHNAIQSARSLPENYFSFLGPLVDIRHGSTESQNLNGISPRTVHICHHSLSQWIAGFGSNTPAELDPCAQFKFAQIDSHIAISTLCLTILSSKEQLLDYLTFIYQPALTHTPLVNYAGEYWSYHLRIAGGPRNLPWQDGLMVNNLGGEKLTQSDFAFRTLQHSIDIAAEICAALSHAISLINLEKVRDLAKVVAVRNLKLALLPASQDLSMLKPVLVEIFTMTKERQTKLKTDIEEGKLSAMPSDRQRTLNKSLDSEIATQVLSTLEPTKGRLTKLFAQDKYDRNLRLICRTSRNLRQLSILLAADPLRAWMYAETGGHGVSPLAALAHASEAIDTYIGASILPPFHPTRYDFRDQFIAELGHQDYGLVIAARHELAVRNYDGLDTIFYQQHIMERYRISSWEFNKIKYFIAALQMDASDAYYLDQIIRGWIVTHNLHPKGKLENHNSAFSIITSLRLRRFEKEAGRVKERLLEALVTALQGLSIFCVKFITFICPEAEHLYISAGMYIGLVRVFLKPTVKHLLENWKDLAISLLLYSLRCRYAPWIFAGGHQRTKEDLLGILADPMGYVPEYQPVRQGGWFLFMLFMTQELIFWAISVLDILDVQSKNDMLPDILLRRISFRIDPRAGVEAKMQKMGKAVSTHGFYIFLGFRRIIFLERIFLIVIYWIYDLIRSSALITISKRWNWSDARLYAIQLVSFAYGRSAGVMGSMKLFARIYFWTWLTSHYQPSAVFGLIYRYILAPVGMIFLQTSQYIFRITEGRLQLPSQFGNSFRSVIFVVLSYLETRTLVYCVAGMVCTFGVFFWYITKDPLGLKAASRSCSEAERLAIEITGFRDATASLKWRADTGAGMLQLTSTNLEEQEESPQIG
jgi:hypothetical protein